MLNLQGRLPELYLRFWIRQKTSPTYETENDKTKQLSQWRVELKGKQKEIPKNKRHKKQKAFTTDTEFDSLDIHLQEVLYRVLWLDQMY